jgi:hypothetical protein
VVNIDQVELPDDFSHHAATLENRRVPIELRVAAESRQPARRHLVQKRGDALERTEQIGLFCCKDAGGSFELRRDQEGNDTRTEHCNKHAHSDETPPLREDIHHDDDCGGTATLMNV